MVTKSYSKGSCVKCGVDVLYFMGEQICSDCNKERNRIAVPFIILLNVIMWSIILFLKYGK